MSKSDFLEQAILNHTLRNIAYTPPASIWVGLFTTVAGESAPGTEVSGNGYARQQVIFGAPSGNACSNTNNILFPAGTPGGYGTVVAAGLFDAPTGGNFLRYSSVVTPKTYQAGDAPTFLPGQIVITED